MLKSELEHHVNEWPEGETRVYRFKMGIYIPHVVSIIREKNIYKCVKEGSTYKDYPDSNSQELMDAISTNRLTYHDTYRWHFDPVRLRTGGCDCGAFITTEPNLHSPICNLYSGCK